MVLSMINKALSADYEIARSIIKIKHLNGNDPNITEEVSELEIDNSVINALYQLLAESIIKENHLNKSDRNIMQKVDQMKIDNNVKKAVYEILGIK